MAFLTDRKRAHGMGSGRAGTHHHWQMMASSMVLVPLVPVFLITFGMGFGGTYEEVLAYFARPFPAIITALMLVVGLLHLRSETIVAVEDYMHGLAEKLTVVAVTALTYTLIAIGLFAIARIAL